MLCDDCRTKWDAWTNYQAPIGRWVQYAPYRQSLDMRRAMLRARHELIDQQCRLIRAQCAEKHGTNTEGSP